MATPEQQESDASAASMLWETLTEHTVDLSAFPQGHVLPQIMTLTGPLRVESRPVYKNGVLAGINTKISKRIHTDNAGD